MKRKEGKRLHDTFEIVLITGSLGKKEREKK